MDADSFIVHVKANNVYKDIAEDAEKRFDTSNCKQIDCYQQVIKFTELMKDELQGEVMTKLVGARPKVHSTQVFDR